MTPAAILDEHLAGDGAPNVALMRLLMEARSPDEARGWIEARAAAAGPQADRERLREILALLDGCPDGWRTIRAVLAEADHAAPRHPAGWGAVFDRIAAIAPEAGAALYGLGSAELLQAATAETVDLVRRLGLLGTDRDVLEIGCGWGRIAMALAPEIRGARGLDVSSAMVAEARRRAAGMANLRFDVTDGSGLAPVPDGSVDLVLAADVFPYLAAAAPDFAARHVAEAGRALRPGGSLLVLNYSYRGDDRLDAADFERACAPAGLAAIRVGTRDLRLWDARTFLARKQG